MNGRCWCGGGPRELQRIATSKFCHTKFIKNCQSSAVSVTLSYYEMFLIEALSSVMSARHHRFALDLVKHVPPPNFDYDDFAGLRRASLWMRSKLLCLTGKRCRVVRL
jgi:hypothetical protein